jgi:hypothetical protein
VLCFSSVQVCSASSPGQLDCGDRRRFKPTIDIRVRLRTRSKDDFKVGDAGVIATASGPRATEAGTAQRATRR